MHRGFPARGRGVAIHIVKITGPIPMWVLIARSWCTLGTRSFWAKCLALHKKPSCGLDAQMSELGR